MMSSNHLILCRPLLLSPSTFPSIRVFSNESVLRIQWPKYLSFSFSISPWNEYSGLISFRMGCLDLLAVQGTFKSLLQHHTSKASVPKWSVFFMVQFSHPYMPTGKVIALPRWTFVSKSRVVPIIFFSFKIKISQLWNKHINKIVWFTPQARLLPNGCWDFSSSKFYPAGLKWWEMEKHMRHVSALQRVSHPFPALAPGLGCSAPFSRHQLPLFPLLPLCV